MAGAFGGSDYRQTITLAIQEQGADALTIVRDAIRQVESEIEVLNGQFDGTRPREYINALNSLGAQLNKLRSQELGIVQTFEEGTRARIDAIAREERARTEAAERERQAAGDALRARIDALAREERAADEANRRQLELVGDLMRARIDAHAREQAAAEQAARAEHAAIQERIEDEARLQAALGRMEQRQHDLAAEQAYARVLQEQAEAEAALARAGVEKRARIEALARAERELEAATRAAAAAEDREFDELEQLNQAFRHNAETVGMATRATREQVQALKDMGIIQDAVTTRVAQGNGQFGGFATAAEQAADKTKRFGYAAMNASYLVQDMQYGIGAVANNVGLMATSLANAAPKLDAFITKIGVPGGAVGLGAGIMVAAVAADVLYHNWGTVAAALGAGLPPKVLGDTRELEERLKALTEKKWKTDLDFSDIVRTREELEKLQADEAAYRRLKGQKTEAQQKQADLVTAAIVEGGGGDDYKSSVENVVAALQKVRGEGPRSREILELEKKRDRAAAEQRRQAESGVDDFGAAARATGQIEEQIEAQAVADRENRRKEARDIVSRASEGNVGALRELQGAFGSDPGAFALRKVDVLRFGAGLENARPENLFAEDRRKHEAELKKKEEQAYKESERINKEAADNAERARLKAIHDNVQATATRVKVQGEFVKAMDQGEKMEARGNAADARDARNAQDTPAEQARKTQMAYGQEFQSRAMKSGVPISGQQATLAGRDIAGMVGGGADVDSAMQQALVNLSALVGRQNMQALRNAAAWERLNGIVGEATMAVNMIETQQRRAQQVTRTNNVHP